MLRLKMSLLRSSLSRLYRLYSRYSLSNPSKILAHRPLLFRNQPSMSSSSESQSSSEATSDLVISDHAVQRLKSIATSGESLRVLVDSGGCSGFEYKFQLVQAPESDDRVFEKDGVRVVVDEISLDFLKGATIDYQTELIKSAFRIVQNPRAEKGCSCGASFALKTSAGTKK